MRLVKPEETSSRRVFVTGHHEDICSFNVAVAILREKGYYVVNAETYWGGDLEDEACLRADIALLTTCDAICLLEDWWASTESHYLQNIAAWLRLDHVDPKTGLEIETVSLKGVKA